MDRVFPLKWHEKNVNIGKNYAMNFFFNWKKLLHDFSHEFLQYTTFLQYNC